MFYVFDDPTLMFILAGCFLAGFLPLFIMFLKCPEARAFITCWLRGGVVISSADDSGQIEFLVAKPLGEGQYIAGKNKLGQRKIFVVPRINNPFITKRFMLKGIRRPLFDHYGGKTVIVNKETLAAIEVAEQDKAGLSENLKVWAESTGISTVQDKPGPDPKEAPLKASVYESLFTVDPRKLRYYFSRHYDESQYDVLLARARQEGYEERGGFGGIGKILLLVLVVGGVALLALVLLKGVGVIRF